MVSIVVNVLDATRNSVLSGRSPTRELER